MDRKAFKHTKLQFVVENEVTADIHAPLMIDHNTFGRHHLNELFMTKDTSFGLSCTQ